ncbi:MAG: hypothetical protein RL757_2828, partial [Bacteroidota bacterium]
MAFKNNLFSIFSLQKMAFWKFDAFKMLFFVGILTVFIVPPFQVPDEFNHFFRAWNVSEGHVTGKMRDARVGDELPKTVYDFAAPFRQIPFHCETKINFFQHFQQFWTAKKSDFSERQFIDFPNTAVYAPTAYLPQSLVIKVGVWLKLPMIWIFYLARLANFGFWFLMISIALKMLKPFDGLRNLFLILAMLPATIFIAASNSADVATNGMSFIFYAACFAAILTPQHVENRSNFAWILGGSLFISLNKLAYVPTVLLIFLIPKTKFNSEKQRFWWLGGIFFLNVLVAVAWFLNGHFQHLTLNEVQYSPNFVAGQQITHAGLPQIAWILENPFAYFKILIYSLFKTAPHTWLHYIGKFGWERNYLPIPLLVFWTFIAFFSVIKVQKETYFSKRQRLLMFGIGVLTTLVFATMMYALWSYVGAGFIENLGGKYFIPIFPLFFAAFYGVFTFRNPTISSIFQKIGSKMNFFSLSGGLRRDL